MADDILNSAGDTTVANIRIGTDGLKKDIAEIKKLLATIPASKNGIFERLNSDAFMTKSNGKRIGVSKTVDSIQQLRESVQKKASLYGQSDYWTLIKADKQLDNIAAKKLKDINNELKPTKLKDYFSSFNSGVKSVGSSISKIFSASTIKSFVTLISGRFLFRYAKEFSQFAGDYIENLNLIENAYGKNSKAVAQWAKEFGKSLGVSINEVMRFAGSFQSLMETMVGTTEVGQRMSVTLTKLTYDIASLRNMDFSEAYNKVQSTIFGGQLKTSRFLGVDISTNALDELLEDLGMVNVRARDLSEAEKVYLRFIKTVNSLEVSGAFGDLAETISSVSNRIRILRGSWENLMTTIGNATSGIINNLLAKLIGIIQALTFLVETFWKLPDESGFNNTVAGIDAITESVDDLNASMGLLNIDKFNVLSQGDSSGAGAGIGEALAAEAEKAVEKYEKIEKTFEKIDEQVRNIRNSILSWIFPYGTITEDLEFIVDENKTLNDLLQAVWNLITKITDLFKNNKEQILNVITKVGNVLADIATVLINVISKIVEIADKLGILDDLIIAIVVVGGIAKLLSALGGLQNSLIAIVSIGLFTFITKIADALGPIGGIIIGITATVLGLAAAIAVLASIKDITKVTLGQKLAGAVAAVAVIAGLTATIQGISKLSSKETTNKYANSGIPDHGSLYWAGEGSRPEILYNAGGRTNVIDSEILGDQFYNAIVRANRTTGGSAGNGNMVAKLVINGKELADATFNDFDYYSRRTTGRGLISK